MLSTVEFMKNIIALVFMLSFSLPMMAITPAEQQEKELKKSHHVVNITPDEAIDSLSEQEMINMFYYDQFRHFQDPLAPYFMLMSKTHQYAMGIGGVVRMRGWYDWNGAMSNSAFIPYDITIPGDPTRKHWTGSTPAGTALFFSVFGRHTKFGRYQLYIEANFNGYGSRDFKLKKAYATVGDWTLGYTNSTFSDPAAQPPTVDGQGPNSETSDTNVLLRWMHTIKEHYVIAASVETPDGAIPSRPNTYTGCSDYMPNFAAFMQYQWGTGQHVRLSGVVRGLEYRDLVEGKNYKKTGWGVHASTVFRPVAPLTVYGAVITGKGLGSLINDLQNSPMDLVGDTERPGRMLAPLSFGWYAALQYHFRPNLFSTIVFSEERFLPKDEPVYENITYKYGLYGAANIFWNITPRCQAAVEYNLGKRQNIDRSHSWVNRVSLMAQFSF